MLVLERRSRSRGGSHTGRRDIDSDVTCSREQTKAVTKSKQLTYEISSHVRRCRYLIRLCMDRKKNNAIVTLPINLTGKYIMG